MTSDHVPTKLADLGVTDPVPFYGTVYQQSIRIEALMKAAEALAQESQELHSANHPASPVLALLAMSIDEIGVLLARVSD